MILGVVTLRAFDSKDVFLREDVYLDGVIDANEYPCDVLADPGFEYGVAYLTGHVPQAIPVDVDGDSGMVLGWFQTYYIYQGTFTVNIYLLCEEIDAQEELTNLSNDGNTDTATDS